MLALETLDIKTTFLRHLTTTFYGHALTDHTVKLARAKLPANVGNFTCSSQVKMSLAQFTCVTCS